jgi:voltage-gated sodium channel
MTALLRNLLAHPYAERIVLTLIMVNAVTLGLETSKTIMAEWGRILHIIDTALLSFFVAELAARLWVKRLSFFKDGWNVFDFVVVAVALAPATENLSVLRSLRILRALRLITAVPSLKRVVTALISALPGMGSIVLLLGLIFYVGAVMATKLFGDVEFGPEKDRFFGTLGASLISLFQVMTLDSWSSNIMRPVLAQHPYAWLFFVPFVLVTAFTALNLFIGVVVSALESEGQAAREAAMAKSDAEGPDGEPPPITTPVTNLDVLTELRALREQVAQLEQRLPPRNGLSGG